MSASFWPSLRSPESVNTADFSIADEGQDLTSLDFTEGAQLAAHAPGAPEADDVMSVSSMQSPAPSLQSPVADGGAALARGAQTRLSPTSAASLASAGRPRFADARLRARDGGDDPFPPSGALGGSPQRSPQRPRPPALGTEPPPRAGGAEYEDDFEEAGSPRPRDVAALGWGASAAGALAEARQPAVTLQGRRAGGSRPLSLEIGAAAGAAPRLLPQARAAPAAPAVGGAEPPRPPPAAGAELAGALAAQRDAHERELQRLAAAQRAEVATLHAELEAAAQRKAAAAGAELALQLALLQQRLEAVEGARAEQLAASAAQHERQLAEVRAAQQTTLELGQRRAADALAAERDRAAEQMAQATALLESALRTQERSHEAALEAARRGARDELERCRAQAESELEAAQRAHRQQLGEAERRAEATLAAAERRAAEGAASTAQLHRAQLAALGHVQGESAQLGGLAELLRASAESLGGLQAKLEQEAWKGVLRAEKGMLDKERALQEVEARRERAYAQREAVVAQMGAELRAEAQRQADVWEQAQAGWRALTGEHAQLRAALGARQLELAQLGEGAHARLDELLCHVEAERALLGQERAALREERRGLTDAALQHRRELGAQRERLAGEHRALADGQSATLQRTLAQQRAADEQAAHAHASKRSAELERALAAKERAALGEHMASLQLGLVESAAERSQLRTAAESLAQRTAAISALHKEMALERGRAGLPHVHGAQRERGARAILEPAPGNVTRAWAPVGAQQPQPAGAGGEERSRGQALGDEAARLGARV